MTDATPSSAQAQPRRVRDVADAYVVALAESDPLLATSRACGRAKTGCLAGRTAGAG